MKDPDFKELKHVIGKGRKICTKGQELSHGYKPDLTIADANKKIIYIIENENKTDRKAYLGDMIKALHYGSLNHVNPVLIIVLKPQKNTTIKQIGDQLKTYFTWLKKYLRCHSLSRVLIIEDRVYKSTIRNKITIGSKVFTKKSYCVV